MQSYVSNILTTQVMKEWVMSTIEDNSATPRFPSSVRAWMESSKHGEDEKSRNMINVHLAHEKSKIEHRSSNISCPVENVADSPNRSISWGREASFVLLPEMWLRNGLVVLGV